MLKEILPDLLIKLVDKIINYNGINEIRLRANKPVIIIISGQPFYLGDNGLTNDILKAVFADNKMIEDTVYKASQYSIYAVNDQIQKGYICVSGGVRVGVCGEAVLENNKIKTIKNFSSVNIRIPHQIKNCCLKVFNQIVTPSGINNTLIISSPGAGKTTFLRDIAFQISEHNYCLNTLVIDERGELGSYVNGKEMLSIGKFSDCISNCPKKIAFENGIRSMGPDLIITDEIGNEEDLNSIIYAVNSGVNVIASIHANSLDSVKNKFGDFIKSKTFKRYILLTNKNGPGTIDSVYNENLERIYDFLWLNLYLF